MSSKRKAPAAVKQPAKKVRSSDSRTRSVKQQKHQNGLGATRAAATMNQATTDQTTQQVVLGSAASSSAQHELLYNEESANSYKEVDNHHINEERRIILIGETGTGKSTLGNAILGNHVFKNDGVQMQSNTTRCEVGKMKRKDGKNIVVVDTPGFKNTKQERTEVINELIRCNDMTAPGPHVFCLVIRGDDPFTKDNTDTLDEFCALFGDDIYKYLIVVFTHNASMEKSATTEECLSALPTEFVTKFQKFGGKKIAIESTAEKKAIKKQINELFKLIEEIIKRNDDGYYSEEHFKAAEEAFRKRIHKIQQVEKLYEEKKKSLEDEYQERTNLFVERENQWAKEIQEQTDKYEQEKKRRKREQRVKKAQMNELDRKHKAKIKSLKTKLNKTCEENEKNKKEYEQKIKINEEAKQILFDIIINVRNSARNAVLENQPRSLRDLVLEGIGVFYDALTGCVGNIFVGTMLNRM